MQSAINYAICQFVHYCYLLVFILSLVACQSKNGMSGQLSQEMTGTPTGQGAHAMPAEKNEGVKRLHQEVMTIHDELMRKMDELMQLKRKGKQALSVLDSLSNANPGKENGSIEKQQLKDALQALNLADEAMMNWMRRYDHAMEGMSEDEKQSYLQDEKDKLLSIKEEMLQSIETGRQLVK